MSRRRVNFVGGLQGGNPRPAVVDFLNNFVYQQDTDN
jgi:hypothetical protein